MSSKFRRNANKDLLNHINDYNDVRKDVDIVQDQTSNAGIITVINPLSDDLDMNDRDILNCNNADIKIANAVTVNTTNISPIAGLINVQGDILFNRQGSIYDTNAIRTGAFIVNNISKNTVNPGLNTEIKILSNLDLNTNNNITGVNNIETKTINGGELLTNPLSSDLNMAGFSIYNAGGVSTNILNSNADGTPIYVNTNIDMTGFDIIDVGQVETASIRILDQVDLNNTAPIIGCTEIFCNDAYAKRILKNQVASAEDIQMEKIRMLENINMDNNSIDNVNVLTTNSITSDQAFITVDKSIVMGGNSISITGTGGIYTEIADVSNKIDLGLTGQIFNGVLIQTNELQADTLKSVSPSTADISVMNNMNMQQKNISDVQEIKLKQIRKSTIGAQFNDIMIYDGINMNNQKIINCNDLKMTGPINTAGNSINLNGGQLNNVDSMNIVGDGKITGVGDITTTTINGYNPAYNPSIADQNMNLNSITNTNNLQVHSLSKTTTIPGANILFNSPIDMNLNNLLNVSQLTTRQINNVVYVRSSADLTSVIPAGIYVICGQVILTQPYNIGGDVSFFGLGNTTSELLFNSATPSGTCINTIDNNVSFHNLKITNTSTALRLFNGTNGGQTKRLSFNNCLITDCKNEMFNILGYDLIDFNHTNFIYNYPTALHLYISGCTKLIIDGCNFSDSYKLTDPPTFPAVFGLSNLIDLYGSFNSIVITNSYISPVETQTGLFIDNAQTSQYTLISGNSFIDGGLTTGAFIFYTLSNHPELYISDNNIPNVKAVLEGSVINNTTLTATVLNTYVAVNWGAGFTVPTNIRFATTAVPFEFKYVGKSFISCLIICNVLATHTTNSDDIILFGISKNGTMGVIVQTLITQGQPKTFSYSTVLSLSQNDLLQFKVLNSTAGTAPGGFLGQALNATLTEI